MFNARGFYHSVMTNYNPKERDAVEVAMKELVSEGFVEEQNGQHRLTQKGYDRIYP